MTLQPRTHNTFFLKERIALEMASKFTRVQSDTEGSRSRRKHLCSHSPLTTLLFFLFSRICGLHCFCY